MNINNDKHIKINRIKEKTIDNNNDDENGDIFFEDVSKEQKFINCIKNDSYTEANGEEYVNIYIPYIVDVYTSNLAVDKDKYIGPEYTNGGIRECKKDSVYVEDMQTKILHDFTIFEFRDLILGYNISNFEQFVNYFKDNTPTTLTHAKIHTFSRIIDFGYMEYNNTISTNIQDWVNIFKYSSDINIKDIHKDEEIINYIKTNMREVKEGYKINKKNYPFNFLIKYKKCCIPKFPFL